MSEREQRICTCSEGQEWSCPICASAKSESRSPGVYTIKVSTWETTGFRPNGSSNKVDTKKPAQDGWAWNSED